MVFQSEYAGKLRIRWEYVANLVVDKPANLLFDTGDEISVYSVEIGDQKITYRSADDHKIYTMDAYGIVGASCMPMSGPIPRIQRLAAPRRRVHCGGRSPW